MARGQLRIHLGAAPGVGKTVAMLGEAHRRAERGTDVVVGICETHGRAKTAAQIGDLETVPLKVIEHREASFRELTPEALRRRMGHGHIDDADNVDTAQSSSFRPGNLSAL